MAGESRFDQFSAGIADIEAPRDQRLRRRRRENVFQFDIDAIFGEQPFLLRDPDRREGAANGGVALPDHRRLRGRSPTRDAENKRERNENDQARHRLTSTSHSGFPSPSDRVSVAPRIGGAEPCAGRRIAHDDLRRAERPAIDDDYLVSLGF